MKKQFNKNSPKGKEDIVMLREVEKSGKFTELIGLFLIILLGCLIYSNSFNATFHFDDEGRIVENEAIRNLFNLNAIWDYGKMRFVAYYTFAVNYHFGKLDVWGYHLFNLSIHLLTTLLVYWISLLICSSPAVKESSLHKDRKIIAFIVAILFVSHPLATQSVVYIVQRMASLVALFYMLSLCLYMQGRLVDIKNNWRYALYFGSLVSACLAFFTKENAFTIPFAMVLLEFFFFNKNKFSINFKEFRIIAIAMSLIGFIVIVINKYSSSIFRALPPDEHSNFVAVNSLNYLYTQFVVILKYIQLLVLPIQQNLDYDFPIVNNLWSFVPLGSLILLTGLIILAVRLYNTHRILSFGIFWFFLTLSVESSIIPISDVIYEHRTYLPSFGFFLIISVLISTKLWNKSKLYGLIFLFLVVGTNSYLTYSRNKVWKNDVTLWNDVISKSPNKARGYNNRGMLLKETNRFEEMLRDFNKAVELQPSFTDAYNNRGNVYVKQENYKEALANFNKAVELKPIDADGYNNRGTANMGMKLYTEAILDFNQAIFLKPNYIMAFANRGITYLNMGKKDSGCLDLKKSIELGFEPTKAIYKQYCQDTSIVK